MDKLHFIVQSFNEEEKKGFEHFVNRFRVRSNRKDLDLFNLVDTPAEAVDIINDFYKKYTLKPNF